jgi:hypothetical protein
VLRQVASLFLTILMLTNILGCLGVNLLVRGAPTEITIDTEVGESLFTTSPLRQSPYYWVHVHDHDVFNTQAYGGDYWYTLCGADGSGEPLYFGTWEVSLPSAGKYEVFVWIPNPDAFEYDGRTYTPTQSAVYQIYHKDGLATKVVNQTLRTGAWYSLGTFTFASNATVVLNDRTSEPYASTMIAFDAIKFVKSAVDFSITTSKTSLSIQQGSSNSSTIAVTSIGGFSQPIKLAGYCALSGVTATFSPPQVTPPAGGSKTSILTVSVAATTTVGTCTLIVGASNETLTCRTDISLEITLGAPTAKLFVQPDSIVDETLTPGNTFKMSIKVANMDNLYAYEFKMKWEFAKVELESATRPSGHFLEPTVDPANHFALVWTINETRDATYQTAHLGYTLLAPETARTGSGTLVEMTFRVQSTGASAITIEDSKLSDTAAASIPLMIANGYFSNVPLKFKVGDRVRTLADLNVREGPGLSYAIIDTIPEGTLGQIVGGPVEVDDYIWWNVSYDIGITGWSAEDWLEPGITPPSGQPPDVPEYFFQYRADLSEIPIGGFTDENSVVFVGVVRDPDGDKVRLQIELRNLHENGGQFDETVGGFKNSDLVESGGSAYAYATELIDESYHWRARAVDIHGLESSWVDFGKNDVSQADFIVTLPPPTQIGKKILPVPYYSQGDSLWCAPTSMSMIFKYYGQNIHSWDIAKDWNWPADVQWWRLDTLSGNIQNYFENRGLTTECTLILTPDPSDYSLFDDIKGWVDRDMPILIYLSSLRHAIVIVGYQIMESSNYVYINDPSGVLGETGLGSSDYPQMAIQVSWSSLFPYFMFGSYLIAVGGTPQPAKGTIDIQDIFPRSISFSEARLAAYGMEQVYVKLYGLSEGLVWNADPNQRPHPISLSPADCLMLGRSLINQMEVGENYLIEVSFETFGYSNSIFQLHPINGRSNCDIFTNPVSLADLLAYPGEYTIAVRLWNQQRTEKYDEIILPKIKYSAMAEFCCYSPCNLCIVDPQGRRVGVDPSTGQVVNDIPGAVYTGPESEPEIIAISDPLAGNYTILLVGTAVGKYTLEAKLISLQETTFITVDIPVSFNAIHQYIIDWDALALGGEGVTVQVDSNGDGVVEYTFTSDSELTRAEFIQQTGGYSVGDINKDGTVDIFDLVTVVIAFGSTPTDPSWDPNSDLHVDGVIDILDIAVIAVHFGETS